MHSHICTQLDIVYGMCNYSVSLERDEWTNVLIGSIVSSTYGDCLHEFHPKNEKLWTAIEWNSQMRDNISIWSLHTYSRFGRNRAVCLLLPSFCFFHGSYRPQILYIAFVFGDFNPSTSHQVLWVDFSVYFWNPVMVKGFASASLNRSLFHYGFSYLIWTLCLQTLSTSIVNGNVQMTALMQ